MFITTSNIATSDLQRANLLPPDSAYFFAQIRFSASSPQFRRNFTRLLSRTNDVISLRNPSRSRVFRGSRDHEGRIGGVTLGVVHAVPADLRFVAIRGTQQDARNLDSSIYGNPSTKGRQIGLSWQERRAGNCVPSDAHASVRRSLRVVTGAKLTSGQLLLYARCRQNWGAFLITLICQRVPISFSAVANLIV